MAYQRRGTSTSKEKLEDRVTSLTEVEPDFDLGKDLDLISLSNFVEDLEDKRSSYNNTLGRADLLRDELEMLEREADDKAERLYAAVIAHFGRDSAQYQQIGGVRKSTINYQGKSTDVPPMDGSDGDEQTDSPDADEGTNP